MHENKASLDAYKLERIIDKRMKTLWIAKYIEESYYKNQRPNGMSAMLLTKWVEPVSQQPQINIVGDISKFEVFGIHMFSCLVILRVV